MDAQDHRREAKIETLALSSRRTDPNDGGGGPPSGRTTTTTAASGLTPATTAGDICVSSSGACPHFGLVR
jgi:hypothetical protein